MNDSFGNRLVPFYPKMKKDTLMTCFALFLYNDETKRHKIRSKLLERFEEMIDEDDCYRHAPVKALVLRLNAIDPKKYPKSAYDMSAEELRNEGHKFIDQSRIRDGYIFDKITYAYLFADIYHINVTVVFYNNGEEQHIKMMKAYYTLYLGINDRHGFHLLIPESQVKKISFRPPRGILAPKMNFLIQNSYDLRKCENNKSCSVVAPIVPPSVRGYKVHMCSFFCEKDNTMFVVFPRNGFKINEPTYIYLNDKLVGYVDGESKTNPYFYIEKTGNYILYVIQDVASQEEARKCIEIEAEK